MEEIFIAFLAGLAEILGEVLLELLGELLVSASLRGSRAARVKSPELGVFVCAVLFGLLGVGIGAVSVLCFPHALFRPSRFHGISLLLAPLLSGLAMAQIGGLVRRMGKVPTRIEHFGYGFVFALGMSIVRFFGVI